MLNNYSGCASATVKARHIIHLSEERMRIDKNYLLLLGDNFRRRIILINQLVKIFHSKNKFHFSILDFERLDL